MSLLHARAIAGLLAGGTIFLVSMLLLAALGVSAGWIALDGEGTVRLAPWLVLEVVAGGAVSVVAGAVCRRVSGDRRAPVVLASVILLLGLAEASVILRYLGTSASAPTWPVLLAPFVGAVGVFIGGTRAGDARGWVARTAASLVSAGPMRFAAPILLVVAVVGIARAILPVLGDDDAQVVGAALILDLTLTLPAAVYLLLVRRGPLPWLVLLPTFLVGLAIATVAVPSQASFALELMRLVALPVELAVLTYLVVLARRTIRSAATEDEGDFASRLREVAHQVLRARIPADIITTEASILYYALRLPRRATDQVPGFTGHREIGYRTVMVGLGLVLFVETVAVHLLVRGWNAVAAWILTGLSLYAFLWLLGDYRAMSARPIRLTARTLLLRVGLRWEASVPFERIAAIELMRGGPVAGDRESLSVALIDSPNVRLRLYEPIEVIGIYGIRRRVRELWLGVDEASAFCAAVAQRCTVADSTSG